MRVLLIGTLKRAALGTIVILSEFALAAGKDVTYSLQLRSFAPNAGGQEAYALRRESEQREMGVWMNQYLQANSGPVVGGLYSLRFSAVDLGRFFQLYVQTGVGLSTAGPMVELLWGTNLFWVARVDIATHLYFTKRRFILWGYPIWWGISLPL